MIAEVFVPVVFDMVKEILNHTVHLKDLKRYFTLDSLSASSTELLAELS
jgi:hypothetical protein